MLKRVRFKNYKSFSEETIINLEKSKLEILSENNTYNGILKGCAFYGSNASGKTNALNAISVLLDLLFVNGKINIIPQISLFNNDKTAYFEYTFCFEKEEVVYYIEFDRNGHVEKEQLSLNGNTCLLRLGNTAESYITENRLFNANDIDENTLFLRTIYFNTKFSGYPTLIKWFDFLSKSIYINPAGAGGTNIIAFNSSPKEVVLPEYLEQYGDELINAFLEEFGFPYRIRYRKAKNIEDTLGSFDLRLEFLRDNMANIPFIMESYGNKILLTLLPPILSAVKNNSMLIIDEFSSGLHNQLEELLIKFVFNKTTSGQLFFVSHSTNLLKTSLLRPDQIFAVDFDEHGSFLKKFSDEHPRESQNLEKMYLSGVFGGIPLYDETNL